MNNEHLIGVALFNNVDRQKFQQTVYINHSVTNLMHTLHVHSG